MARNIILASTSAGRKALLAQTGLTFTAEPSNYEEDMSLALPPAQLVTVLSQGKARAVAARHDDAIIIGADSVGVLEGTIFGKPKDEADARDMLRRMSGKAHTFVTGLTVIDTAFDKELSAVSETKVYFRELTDEEINNYVASGESLSCAGSYAIQGRGALLVEKIEGEYSTILGISLSKLSKILHELEVNVLATR